MQENDFEKQVRQELERLRLQPSREVWERLEQEIRPQKRRRKVAFWVPAVAAMALLSLGAAWWMMPGEKEPAGDTVAAMKENAGKKEVITSVKDGSFEGNAGKASATDLANATHDRQSSSAKENRPSALEEKDRNAPALASAQTKGEDTIKNLTGHAGYAATGTKDAPVVAISPNNRNKVPGKPLPAYKAQDHTIALSGDQEKFSKLVPADAVPGAGTASSIAYAKTLKTDELIITHKNNWTLPAVMEEKKQAAPLPSWLLEQKLVSIAASSSLRSSWFYGVTASAGASWPVFNGADPSTKLAREQTMTAGATPLLRPGLASPSTPIGVPAAAEPGAAFSFTAGVYGGREWKSRFRIQAGLQYAQFNTEYKVGEYVGYGYANQVNLAGLAGSIESYYQNGTSTDYVSNYHFLEMPVEGAYTLNPRSGTPVSVSAGATVSYLLGTDGLHYNKYNGIYYEDISLYNRTQVSLQAGLSMRLLESRGRSLSAGPVFRYHLTPNRDISEFQRENFTYLGLRVSLGLR